MKRFWLASTGVAVQVFTSVSARAAWLEVPLANLDVTEGQAESRQLGSGLIDITGARFRATERGANSPGVMLTFAYRGEVDQPIPIEGGELRAQGRRERCVRSTIRKASFSALPSVQV